MTAYVQVGAAPGGVPRGAMTCRNGHALRGEKAEQDRRCDECRVHLGIGTYRQWCRGCDYDLCLSCLVERGGADPIFDVIAKDTAILIHETEQHHPTKVLKALEGVQKASSVPVSLADLLVLGGNAAIEAAAKAAGHSVTVPFRGGRVDATAEQTDVESFKLLEPYADGFRNWGRPGMKSPAEAVLIDKAQLLTLTPPELTVLVGGLRVLGANSGGSPHGVFTQRVGQLTNDFFVNLLDMGHEWAPSQEPGLYKAHSRKDGKVLWTGTRADLVFGSHAELRALAEVYAEDGNERKFVDDFVRAWVKVMELDRFDLK